MLQGRHGNAAVARPRRKTRRVSSRKFLCFFVPFRSSIPTLTCQCLVLLIKGKVRQITTKTTMKVNIFAGYGYIRYLYRQNRDIDIRKKRKKGMRWMIYLYTLFCAWHNCVEMRSCWKEASHRKRGRERS